MLDFKEFFSRVTSSSCQQGCRDFSSAPCQQQCECACTGVEAQISHSRLMCLMKDAQTSIFSSPRWDLCESTLMGTDEARLSEALAGVGLTGQGDRKEERIKKKKNLLKMKQGTSCHIHKETAFGFSIQTTEFLLIASCQNRCPD